MIGNRIESGSWLLFQKGKDVLISPETSETHFHGITEEKGCCGEAGCQLGSDHIVWIWNDVGLDRLKYRRCWLKRTCPCLSEVPKVSWSHWKRARSKALPPLTLVHGKILVSSLRIHECFYFWCLNLISLLLFMQVFFFTPIKLFKRAIEKAQWVKTLATNSDKPNSMPRHTQWKGTLLSVG